MADAKTIKEWVSKRIDYWEDEIERAGSARTPDIAEGEAMLAAFYMVTEFIDGQRR